MVVDTLTDEEGRLGALHRHGLPNAGPFEPLERIARIAQVATGAPMVTVSILDRSTEIVLAASGAPDRTIAPEQSLAAMAIGSHRPLIIADTATDPSCGDRFAGGNTGVRAYLGVPLETADRYNIGVLAIMDTRPRQFTEAEMAIAVNLARLAMSHLASYQPSDIDHLTGALTRHRFQAEVEREFARATRYERPAALMFLDIDGFREVNSALGAEMAEEVLKSVANRAAESLRSADTFGRIGGEEFGILLPETLAYEANQCAERLREDIARLRVRHAGGVLSVTASFGIAPLAPALRSAIQWFAQADIALYGSKQAGRNCVTFAPPAEADDLPPISESAGTTIGRVH